MALHAPGLTEDVLVGLLEMEAESQGIDPRDIGDEYEWDISVLEEQVDAYESALDKALIELVRRYPPENGASADDLQNADAAYLVLMTLRGEGVGIWDGDWDDFYDNSRLSRGGDVWKFLHARLKSFADDTGGGSLNTAIMDAVGELAHPEEYGEATSSPAVRLSRRKLGEKLLEWHSSMSDPVYAVGSFYYDDHVYPKADIVQEAIDNLEKDLDQESRMLAGETVMVQRQGKRVSLRKFAGYTDAELRERVAELTEIVGALKGFYERDYGMSKNRGRRHTRNAHRVTVKNLTDAQISRLRSEAAQSHDYELVAICDLALSGEFDGDDYSVLNGREIRKISAMTQHDAYEAIVEALNDEAS